MVLKVASLDLEIFAHAAADCEGLHRAIRWVLDSEGAVLLALALVAGRPAAVVAVHAVVVDSTAVIGSDVAAKVAFVLNVVLLMLFTVADAVLIVLVLVEETTLRTHLCLKRVSVHVQTVADCCSTEDSAPTTAKDTTCGSLLLLLSLKLLHVCVVAALPEPAEVGVLALVAFIVVEMVDGELLEIFVVLALGV